MNSRSHKFIPLFFFYLIIALQALPQLNVSVDVNQVVKTNAEHSVGININYLMDGSYISATTTANTTEAVKGMKMKILRYPGGEKSDNYLWSSPPYDRAKPGTLLTGNCQFPSNDGRFFQSDFSTAKPEVLDFDEFMVMAKAVGAEPMIVCAYDAAYYGGSIAAPYPCGIKPTLDQLINIAKEWVRYANKTKNYNVKYWCIGNESWNNCLYNGCVSADQYAIDIVKFADTMRSVDPTIKIIANGLGAAWWQKLVQNAASARVIDYLGVSCYPVYGFSGGYDDYRNKAVDLRDDLREAANAIRNFASALDKTRIKVIATEFNSMDWSGDWKDTNDVGHALVSAEILGQGLRTQELESMVFWNTRWIDNTTKPNDIFDALNKNSGTNANGLMLSAMANSLLPAMLQTTEDAKVKTFAFFDQITNNLNVVLINRDNVSQPVNVGVLNYNQNPSCVRWQFKGIDMNDIQPTYTREDLVVISSYPYFISLPRNSITILKMAPPNIVLPLPLLSFTSTLLTNGYAQLTWQTNINDVNSFFGVQKSTDNQSWTNIGRLPADGSVTNKTYQFEDPNPFTSSDRVYYRIVKTDASGKNFISAVKILNKVLASDLMIRLRNNPVQDNANFTINGIQLSTLKVNLLDTKGVIFKTYPEIASDGSVSMSVKGLPSGVYFFQFISSVAQRVVKVVKN